MRKKINRNRPRNDTNDRLSTEDFKIVMITAFFMFKRWKKAGHIKQRYEKSTPSPS